GEHTDYNDGFVLPMAIDRAIWIALRPRDGRRVQVHSLDYEETVEFPLDGLRKGDGWGEYIKGVANELRVEGFKLAGWEGVLGGDVPKGAGLSSSAALELAATRAFAAVSGFDWQPARMAQIGQKAENHWVGVNCGIMDQMVSAAAQAGHALFLDCRSLEYEHVPLPLGVAVVVMDTSTRRGLVDSAYNERRAQCEAAAEFFGVPALRDVSLEEFNGKSSQLENTVMRRARHIITENQRVLQAVAAMEAGDVRKLGILFNESHTSMRDDFEITNEALNQIVEAAQMQPACLGARMTGGGFGGCAVALVDGEQVEAFTSVVMEAYRRRSGLEAQFYACQPGQGASITKLSIDE
ncbi:MAG: galactokinase, partial [Anaerolineales bacterium]|nr:galactokinase [Anaerolineales bacterium]